MMRSRYHNLAVILLWAPALAAQLPYLTAPTGTLRIELDGAFLPGTREYADGTSRLLGEPVSGGALEAELAGRLGALLGRPASTGTLGLSADIMHQRGDGGIGLAVGITPRLTVSARLPIISVRTESSLRHDAALATLGINPALRGDGRSAAWLEGFGAALTELQERRDAGEYASDPLLQALANDILANAPAWRAGMAGLLVDPASASLVLPLATSTDGTALLDRAATYRDQLSGSLGVSTPTGLPVLPSSGMSAEEFAELLIDPSGFGLAPVEEQPFVALGDVELGAVYTLFSSSNPERRRWLGAWLTGGLTLATGTAPRADRLRDQGTGDGQMDVRVGAVVELGSGRLGVRGEAGYTAQLSGQREVRVGPRDAFLLPASRQTTLDWNPGDVLTIAARPFVRVADRLSLTGSASWFRRGTDTWTSDAADGPAPSDLSAMALGSDASAVKVGVGLAYAHDGRHVDGATRMPVEAGLALERTVWSGAGLVAQQTVTRMWFRVYKRLF